MFSIFTIIIIFTIFRLSLSWPTLQPTPTSATTSRTWTGSGSSLPCLRPRFTPNLVRLKFRQQNEFKRNLLLLSQGKLRLKFDKSQRCNKGGWVGGLLNQGSSLVAHTGTQIQKTVVQIMVMGKNLIL